MTVYAIIVVVCWLVYLWKRRMDHLTREKDPLDDSDERD